MGTHRDSERSDHCGPIVEEVSIDLTAHARETENANDESTNIPKVPSLAGADAADHDQLSSPSNIRKNGKHHHSTSTESVPARSAVKSQVADAPTSSKASSRVGRSEPKPRSSLVDALAGAFFSKTSSKVDKRQDSPQEELAKLRKVLEKKTSDNVEQSREISRRGRLLVRYAGTEKQLIERLSATERKCDTLATSLYDSEAFNTSRDATIKNLRSKIKDLQSERDSATREVQDIVRKQQEESFKNIETALWIPREDGQVQDDLDALKRSMKSFAKAVATSEMSDLSSLDSYQRDSIMTAVLSIARRGPNDILLDGMNQKRKSAVILNALVAHAVYSNLFAEAFFFSKDLDNGENPLAALYNMTKRVNEKDAHNWRAQTLRLLHPQLTTSSSEEEVKLHNLTEHLIVEAGKGHAFVFRGSAACAFITDNHNQDVREKIEEIFIRAARLSYELWTRKTTLKVTTFNNIDGHAAFDVDSPTMVPHALMDCDQHDDMLKGRFIRMIVHPMLEVYGTDDGDRYEQSRVLMPFEVWLPSGDRAEPGPEAETEEVDLINMRDDLEDDVQAHVRDDMRDM